MKFYKKSDLEIRNGYLVKDDEIVAIDNEVIDLANELETRYQKALYMAAQPDPVPERSLDGFGRVHENHRAGLQVVIDTPMMDMKIAETLAIMDELDGASAKSDANEILDGIKPLVQFVMADEVIGIDAQPTIHTFDTPKIGNMLEIDGQRLIEVAMVIANAEAGNFDVTLHIADKPLNNADNPVRTMEDLRELLANCEDATEEQLQQESAEDEQE